MVCLLQQVIVTILQQLPHTINAYSPKENHAPYQCQESVPVDLDPGYDQHIHGSKLLHQFAKENFGQDSGDFDLLLLLRITSLREKSGLSKGSSLSISSISML